jgi:hypothetical protein
MARTVHPIAFAGLLAFLPSSAGAADHFDGPGVTDDPSTDIADVYVWTSGDGLRVNLVMDVVAAQFSDAIQYVFHLESAAAFGQTGTRYDLICTFDAEQTVSCWLGDDEYAGGTPSGPLGARSESGRMRVFGGKRSDPFFFNAEGFSSTISKVQAAASALTFDAAGCPAVDGGTSSVLVTSLQTGATGGPPTNFFRSRRVSSLVIELDKTLINGGGPILAVWASTRR